MHSIDHASLAPLTTLEIGGPATRLVEISEPEEIADLADEVVANGPAAPCVIGSGSNILVADAGYDGLVAHMRTRGTAFAPHPDGRRVVVTVQAGHILQDLVDQTVAEHLSGLEMLTGIPGTVGATPIQNVGAYGQEVCDVITTVRVFDWRTREFVELTGDECLFGHRTSRFKHTKWWTIAEVSFALCPSELSCPIVYRAVAETAGVKIGQAAPLEVAVAAVRDVRMKKGMILEESDPDRRSVGSVFLSPVIGEETAAPLRGLGAPVNNFPDGTTRVSASWVIKEAGFSLGERLASGVRISNKHFTLVADDGATAATFSAAAALVASRVEGATGVRLTAEPDLIGDLPAYKALTSSPAAEE